MKEIKLLDGTDWVVDDLLDHMQDNSFYYGYLSKACLSSSSCKKILDDSYSKEPASLNPNSKPLRDGRLIHVTLLENEKLDEYYHFVDVPTRRNKEYKLAVEDPELSKKEIMLTKEKKWAEEIVEAVYKNPTAKKLFDKGTFETPGIDYIKGLPFRGKADCLTQDRIVDLKTTSDVDMWETNINYYGYNIQAYIYSKIFNKKNFTFVIVDKKTLQVKTYDASYEDFKQGEAKVAQCIRLYIEQFGF